MAANLSLSPRSRIVSVCDAYNAMTTDRPYRSARRADDAIAELRRCSGSQFDPRVVQVIEGILAPRGRAAEPAGRLEPANRAEPTGG